MSEVKYEIIKKIGVLSAIPVLGKYKGRFEKAFVNIVQSAASRKNKMETVIMSKGGSHEYTKILIGKRIV
jgi:hypothetical protein